MNLIPNPASSGASWFKPGASLLLLLAFQSAGWAQPGAEDLRVTIGKSVVIDYPTDVSRISTSNPEIVDAVAVSTREVLLHAKGHGVSTVVIWAKTGQRTFYNVSVEHNLEPIRKLLKETFPEEPIQIQSARDSVTLIGHVSSLAVSDRAAALVASLAKTVVNNLQINPNAVEKQILLRVKFAELDRNASSQFGVNLLSTGFANTPGLASTGQFSPPRPTNVRGSIPGSLLGAASEFTLTDALNIFAFRPELNLAATIKALQSQALLQILAEPNLVTTNGKDATFLVGGEFPVPILQGGSNAGAVTVQFREFGIRLNFNPQITANKTLKMYVKPEVSSIDIANAVSFSGFRIPALSTRRIETNIELAPGQSFVIGGLLDDRVEDTFNKVPGLSSIPLLGAIFKSRSESKSKTELIVLVTPEIVDPLNPSDPKPMPVMPKEFLGPAVPTSAPAAAKRGARPPAGRKSVSQRGKTAPAESAKLEEPKPSFETPIEPVPAIPAQPESVPAPVPDPSAPPVNPPPADLAAKPLVPAPAPDPPKTN